MKVHENVRAFMYQNIETNTLKCLIDVPPPLINFSIFFHPGYSYSNHSPLPSPY